MASGGAAAPVVLDPTLPTPKLLVVSDWAEPLPSIAGLKIVCIGAGYVGGPTMVRSCGRR